MLGLEKTCENQVCQFEGWHTENGYEEDASAPVLIYCKAQKGSVHDHSGNCRPKWCPLSISGTEGVKIKMGERLNIKDFPQIERGG